MNRTAALVFATAIIITSIGVLPGNHARANPFHREWDFIKVAPPEGTQPPIIAIQTPRNASRYAKNVNLTLDVIVLKNNESMNFGVSELYYTGSWNPNEITCIAKNFGGNASFSINLSAVPGGDLYVTIYALGVGNYLISEEFDSKTYTMIAHYATFETNSYSTVSFVKDLVPPRISVQSPQNTTYTTSEVEVDLTVNEEVSRVLYSIDGKENQTTACNGTLTGLANGEHNLTLCVVDLAGNEASAEAIFFRVNVPESFPMFPTSAATIASIAIVCGLLVSYHKKRRRE